MYPASVTRTIRATIAFLSPQAARVLASSSGSCTRQLESCAVAGRKVIAKPWSSALWDGRTPLQQDHALELVAIDQVYSRYLQANDCMFERLCSDSPQKQRPKPGDGSTSVTDDYRSDPGLAAEVEQQHTRRYELRKRLVSRKDKHQVMCVRACIQSEEAHRRLAAAPVDA
eukprot:scaffold1248_cov393-Prasinococcus_capsulatus_cf.AAC.5